MFSLCRILYGLPPCSDGVGGGEGAGYVLHVALFLPFGCQPVSASSQSSGSILQPVARAHVGSQVHCTSAGSGSSSHCLPPMVVATAGSSVATNRSRVHIV